MLKLYTFIMDYEGGKYISQVHAEDESSAMIEWAKYLNIDQIEDMDEKHKSHLLKIIIDEKPITITGCTHVWSFIVHPLNQRCDVNVVLTVPGD